MQNFTFLKIVLTSILIGGSPSNAFLAEPDQAWPEELARLAFTASHLVVWSVATEMIVYLKSKLFSPEIFTRWIRNCRHVKKPIHVLLIQFTPVAAGIARTELFDRIK